LQLPVAGRVFWKQGGRRSCLGPLAGLEKQRTQYDAAVKALADGQRTRLVLVARAQKSRCAKRPAPMANWRPLASLAVPDRQRNCCPRARRRSIRSPKQFTDASKRPLAAMPDELRALPRMTCPETVQPRRTRRLRQLLVEQRPNAGDGGRAGRASRAGPFDLVDDIAADGMGWSC